MNAITTVPFHQNNLLLIEHNGQPFTAMKPIVEGMGLAWQTQARKFKDNAKRWGITILVTPSKSGNQNSICMPIRKLPAYMASIYPNKVKPELREPIEMYQEECDDALWNYWSEGQAINPRTETITPKQKLSVRDAMAKKVYDNYGKKQIRAGFKTEWHDFYEAFEISKYEELPASRFDDAMGYILGEWIPEQKALTQEVYSFPSDTALPTFKADDVLNGSTLLNKNYESPLINLLNQLQNNGHDVNGAVIELKSLRHAAASQEMMIREAMQSFKELADEKGRGLNARIEASRTMEVAA